MPFSLPIIRFTRGGVPCVRVDVPLVVAGATGDRTHVFRHDTGCDITTVDEGVAAILGLPAGGRPFGVRGATGATTGRVVGVTFRFPPDDLTGVDFEATSDWLVVPGSRQIALLGFHDFHQHFDTATDAARMYFETR